jgi:hypothetical protein
MYVLVFTLAICASILTCVHTYIHMYMRILFRIKLRSDVKYVYECQVSYGVSVLLLKSTFLVYVNAFTRTKHVHLRLMRRQFYFSRIASSRITKLG